MAKKSKAPSPVVGNSFVAGPSAPVATPAPVQAPATSRSAYGLLVRAVKPLPEGAKMATQAKLVYAVIAKAGKEGISETKLAESLVPAGLVTRQSPLRIYRFYRKMLVDGGYITTASA